MSNFVDLTRKKFGRLTVIKKIAFKKGHALLWLCSCECGNNHIAIGGHLKSGNTKSCGCLKKEKNKRKIHYGSDNGNWKGGVCDSGVYWTWAAIIQRCSNPKFKYYQYYGGRGIKVCDEWHDSAIFIKWAEQNGWKKGLTIDRINTNGDYCPENCHFVTHATNCKNTRRSRIWYINGKKFLSSTTAAIYENVNPGTIYQWCYGRWQGDKYYHPKPDCFAMSLYGKVSK